MVRIMRKSSVFYATHLMTFSLIGLPLLHNRLGVIPVMAMLMPLWISSSVLFSEKEESYGFLRILPVTDDSIVRAKFALALAAVFSYWALMTLVTLQTCLGTAYLAANLTMINICTGIGLLLAACWYICIWRLGLGVMAIVILAFMAFNLIVTLTFLFRVGSGARPMMWAPWYGNVLLLLLALLAYGGLMQFGIRVKRMSEAGT